MQSFVETIITEVSSTTVGFITDVVTTYWGTILSISFVLFLIGLFWRLGKMKGR